MRWAESPSGVELVLGMGVYHLEICASSALEPVFEMDKHHLSTYMIPLILGLN